MEPEPTPEEMVELDYLIAISVTADYIFTALLCVIGLLVVLMFFIGKGDK